LLGKKAEVFLHRAEIEDLGKKAEIEGKRVEVGDPTLQYPNVDT